MDDSAAAPGLGLAELRAALASSDPARRAAALSRARPGPGVAEAVIAALHDPNEDVRRACVRTLGRLRSQAATRALISACTGDLSPAVRAEAVAALGRHLAAFRPSTSPPRE